MWVVSSALTVLEGFVKIPEPAEPAPPVVDVPEYQPADNNSTSTPDYENPEDKIPDFGDFNQTNTTDVNPPLIDEDGYDLDNIFDNDVTYGYENLEEPYIFIEEPKPYTEVPKPYGYEEPEPYTYEPYTYTE